MDHGNLRGVGIQKIEQISSSTDSLGANVIRVTLDDGSFYDYTVRNGDRGPAGSIWIGTSAPPDDSYSIWLNPSGMVSGYVGANQGAENAGRVLAVGEDGVVIPREETLYTLPQASQDALGGIKADAAETADTQPVRIGGDGKLYTASGGSGEAVLYTEQSLTEAQQEQARNNIGVRIPFVVTISKDSNGNITADKTFSAIKEAHDAGMTIYAAYKSTMYDLVGYSSDGIASFALNDRYNYIGFTCESSGVEDFWHYYEESLKSLEIFGASAGQVVKVKSVDENGVPTQWEAGDVSSGGADISLGISGATAGQMAKVKAVDASGAPTAWEAGDAAGGYIGYGNRNPDYTYTVTEVISGLYISEINGNTFSANKLACLVEFPAGTGGLYYHALYTLQGSKDKNYCISNHNPPKLSNISTKDSVVFFIVEKLNNQNYKYNYIGQCKKREQLLDGLYGTYAAGIFPNSIEGETSIKSILLKGENAFGVGVKISIWLD